MIQRLKHHLMAKSRVKKIREFISLTGAGKDSTILDVGAANKEYSPYDNPLEKIYAYPAKITALSIYPLDEFSKRYPEIRAVNYMGGEFPFNDNEFSVAFSNAVVEHVGGFEKQLKFINEMYRVGRQLYFTTPAREFPLEMHTNLPLIHWLPKQIFNRVVILVGKGWAAGDYMNLLTKSKLVELMRASHVTEYKIFTYRLGPFPLHYAVLGKKQN